MMQELSLNVLDIANNSIKAGANLIKIYLLLHNEEKTVTIVIKDNGRGMSQTELTMAEDPFFSTRETRKIGLGIPFFKQTAQDTGGSFKIKSTPNKGTIIAAIFNASHIDCPPIGDMCSTIYALIMANLNLDFLYSCKIDSDPKFILDTRVLRDVLQDIPFNAPEVSAFIKRQLKDNQNKLDYIYQRWIN